MTFKTVLHDLGQKFNSSSSNNIFYEKPFICKYDTIEPSGSCCFNHIIGLPIKGTIRPLYKWQKKYLFEPLEKYRYNWIKKSTGIGVSEFVLRYILWKSLVNNDWSNGIVPILTGPNIDLSKRLIARAYEMISEYLPNSKINDYKLMVNGTEIAAFPGKNVDSARSLTNVRLTLLVEADFFSNGEQEDARKIAERYIGKSDARIIMISTPNALGGLFEQIEHEEPCLYNRILLPYSWVQEPFSAKKR